MQRLLLLLVSIYSSTLMVIGQGYFPAPVFGELGCVDYPMGELAPGAEGITHVRQADGKVIVGGYSYYITGNTFHMAMVRIDPVCGQLDSTFGTNGRVVTWFEGGTTLRDLALQPDGKILGCGFIRLAGFAEQAAVFRFNADGSPDPNFNGGLPYRLLPIPGTTASANTAHSMMLDAQGRIMVFARGNPVQFAAFRLLPDGTPDNSYGVNGIALLSFPYTPNSGFASAALDAQGRLVMTGLVGTGPFDPYVLGLARFTADGAVDNTFGIDGQIQFPSRPVEFNASGGKAMEIGLLSDGRIVVSYGHIVSSNYRVQLAAFNVDGSIDNTFGVDGLFTHAGNSARAGGMQVLEDDHVLLFHKNQWNNGPAAIVKVTPNGSLDPAFGNNGQLLAPYGAQPDYRGFQDGFLLDNGHILAYGAAFNNGISIARFTTDPVADALPQISLDFPQLITTGSGTFQWFLDGVAVDGATGNAIVPTENGVYTVEMSLSECTYLSPPFTLLTVGVDDHRSSAIRVLQNPVEDLLLIDNSNPNSQWTLTDLRGAQVSSGSLTPGRNELPLQGVKAGVYLLRVADFAEVYRVVKQ